MQIKEKNYLLLIIAHIIIGVSISAFPSFSKIYGALIFIISIYFIVKTRNRNNEVIYTCAYIVGSEVFLRMTDGNPSYEFSKYCLVFFSLMGMFYSGLSKNAVPYWIFLILLIPAIAFGIENLGIKTNVRTTISFNISGPVSLGFMSLYTYQKKIKISELNNIILILGLPIISCAAYLFLYTSKITADLGSTGSNFDLSGGFGPNQVATALGLGMFVFFSRVLLVSRTKLMLFVNLTLGLYIGYRGILTFSRGGMVTAALMLAILLMIIYLYSKKESKLKIFFIVTFMFVIISSIMVFSAYKTDGLITNRYTNKDAIGRTKNSASTGRSQISIEEFELFLKNPLFGVGVGRGAEIRSEKSEFVASHNELTRMLAEHGSLGLMGLLILFLTPIFLYLDNKEHIYLFCFLTFWLLTINHAAMRTAAPSFIYALTLLKVNFYE